MVDTLSWKSRRIHINTGAMFTLVSRILADPVLEVQVSGPADSLLVQSARLYEEYKAIVENKIVILE